MFDVSVLSERFNVAVLLCSLSWITST
jgi:hypothetical protein